MTTQERKVMEPVTDEENEKFSRDVSNFKGADPEATKYALEAFLRNRALAQPEQKFFEKTVESKIADAYRKGYDAGFSRAQNLQYAMKLESLHKAQPKEPEQEPVASGKLQVTLQDTPTEIELAQYKRMFAAACADLGEINEALGLDPDDGGAEPILSAITELKAQRKEPEQEPAAIVCNKGSKFQHIARLTEQGKSLPDGAKLYTTPPQPQSEARGLSQSKPLTDEQVSDQQCRRLLYGFMLDFNAVGFEQAGRNLHRAIEAAHGIKE